MRACFVLSVYRVATTLTTPIRMLDPATWTPAPPESDRPVLTVLIDTEEEFDWSRPLARENTGVRAMAAQERAHRIFERFGITPIYVIDHPVASQDDGARPLQELFADGKCRIGAHLHPWVSPPHDEAVCNRNSYPGNLPAALEEAKLARLTETIAERFGEAPTVYKAGRYGVGPNTTAILQKLGYQIDTSVVPWTDFSDEEGPDFRACGAGPYWFGEGRRLLEIPLTAGFVGALARIGAGWRLKSALASPAGRRLRGEAILSRTGLFERLRLTPEGHDFDEHVRLTRGLLRRGVQVFSFTYHSPSLLAGCTPYVQSETELRGFLDRFERYFDWFFGTLGGQYATPHEIMRMVPEA